jgi:hypothetical protein
MTSRRISADLLAFQALPRRALPCQDRESTCPMPPRASLALGICRKRRSSNAAETSDGNRVHDASIAPIGIGGRIACCMTWGTWSRAVLATSILRTPSIRAIRCRGRRRWKEDVGYHRRSLLETAMCRMKCCFGDHLKNREIQNQRTETRLRSKILNKFTHLGLPEFDSSGISQQGRTRTGFFSQSSGPAGCNSGL